MRGFFTINTPYEQSPYGYVNTGFTSAVSPTHTRFEDHKIIVIFSEDGAWDDEQDSDQEGCCEDPYDDDEEDEEREWCD
ncbi:hypothetical protein [Sulfuricurvum sp.]|uniref:hypothetical protein n=1 Tax=Sulfuricurvum sp. TaxID=2025608 RepID=UPI0026230C2A|nr:hypothetical protein [Sulfuricurvum sp.]MDD2265801.1 hypothetical protein [Sulfuricurvum sp.]MDD2783518.1 hypothetical protein [Sulfuricurvum sp.]